MCLKYALQSIGQMLEKPILISRSSSMESNRITRVSNFAIVKNLRFELVK